MRPAQIIADRQQVLLCAARCFQLNTSTKVPMPLPLDHGIQYLLDRTGKASLRRHTKVKLTLYSIYGRIVLQRWYANAVFTPGHNHVARKIYPGRTTCIRIHVCRRIHVAGYKLLVRDTCRLSDIITIHLCHGRLVSFPLYPATDGRQTC